MVLVVAFPSGITKRDYHNTFLQSSFFFVEKLIKEKNKLRFPRRQGLKTAEKSRKIFKI